MMPLRFGRPDGAPLRILCLGAHSDDIEIGCGATVLTLLGRHPGSQVRWVVFAATGERAKEANASAARFLERAGESQIDLHGFRDGFFPSEMAAIKEEFERLKSFQPDLVLTHRRADHHQDHRVLGELAWNTFRNHLVWEYEIHKYDGDLGNPNLMVPVERSVAEQKVATLMQCFATQRSRGWFTEETFWALLRLRGIQCASPTGYAEGFHAHKLVV